ncbi:hypothetical protein BKI52_11960 [marine bacterium AO1-C]|nr:hypothetical protein BKI52_11960 [marine bacterium AO1-C]
MQEQLLSSKTTKSTDSFTGVVAIPTIFLFVLFAVGYVLNTMAFLLQMWPNWAYSLIGAILAYGMFTVVHEASHGNISGGNKQFKRLETALGWMAGFFLFFPYSAFVVIHLKHHAHTNDPEHDPDGYVKGNNFFSVFMRCITLVGHYYVASLGQEGSQDVAMKRTQTATWLFIVTQLIIMGLAIFLGYGWAYLYIIAIPALVAAPFLGFFFDWLPHYPHDNMGKYHNTRIITIPGMEWVSLFQSFHLIHHLYPRVPFYKYKQKFKTIETLLRQQKSPIEGLNTPDLNLMASVNTYTDIIKGKTWQYALKVANVTPLTSDSASITFENLNNIAFKFQAGQYLVLSRKVGRYKISRCYSICSAPSSGQLTVGVKRVKGGLLSNKLLDTIKEGDRINVSGPFGSFKLQKSERQVTQTFIAGGSGITPILAMIYQALEEGYQQVYLLYGCRSKNDVMFRDALNELQRQYLKRFKLDICYELLDDAHQKQFLAKINGRGVYYICGPTPMMEASQRVLHTLGVDASRVIQEEFAQQATELTGAIHTIHIKGKSYEAYTSESLLDAAIRQNQVLLFACRMGQCGTCKVKLEQGEVTWIDQEQIALLDNEKANGYILTCMCKPTSDIILKL